jgi:FkbM family methyltransferase
MNERTRRDLTTPARGFRRGSTASEQVPSWNATRRVAARGGRRPPRAVEPDLVYDVGMHVGEDTAFYLRRGYRVVGIEANADLVRRAERRFAKELASGRLTIVPAAVGPERGRTRFAISDDITIWSTGDPGFIERARQQGVAMRMTSVEMTTLDEVMREHGVPFYVKVDIEGMDLMCIRTLGRLPVRPPLISLESVVTSPATSVGAVLREIRTLRELGYRRFKLVDQSALGRLDGTVLSAEGPAIVYRYEEGASGPFGDEAPGRWRSRCRVVPRMLAAVAYERGWGATRTMLRETALGRRVVTTGGAPLRLARPRHRWYDLHGSL